MLVACNRKNHAGGGCQNDDDGPTGFSRDLAREMERVGMVVCCSHTGYRTARDVVEVASNPVIFSHSNVNAIVRHPRNIPDELLRACARTGGVVGVNGIALFLGPAGEDQADLVATHIDHVVQLGGPRHIGLGLDYVFDTEQLKVYVAKMREIFPAEFGYDTEICMLPPERSTDVVDSLLRRFYDEHDVQSILGGNFVRIASQVW